jgi:hypothetical protein
MKCRTGRTSAAGKNTAKQALLIVSRRALSVFLPNSGREESGIGIKNCRKGFAFCPGL